MRKRKMTTLYLMTGVLVLSLLIGLLVHYHLSVEETASKEPVVQEKEPEKEEVQKENQEEKEDEPEEEETEQQEQENTVIDDPVEEEPVVEAPVYEEPVDQEPVQKVPVYTPPALSGEFSDPYSLLVVANKKYALDYYFEPTDLRVVNATGNRTHYLRDCAASALESMFAAAAQEGITLVTCSSYRSASYQASLYNNYVAMYGTATADTISARPGYSDHQTGLAADIGDHDQATVFTQAMEYTVEGQWLYAHAHEYGFILRYPKGKEWITGYSFEPWHYRYVGVDYATAIYNVSPDCTLEEYFGIEGGDYAY